MRTEMDPGAADREQGRPRELEPAIRSFVQQHPAHTWRRGLALIYSEMGREPEARTEFERLAADDFTAILRDALWVICIMYLVEVCAFRHGNVGQRHTRPLILGL